MSVRASCSNLSRGSLVGSANSDLKLSRAKLPHSRFPNLQPQEWKSEALRELCLRLYFHPKPEPPKPLNTRMLTHTHTHIYIYIYIHPPKP